MDAAGAAIAIAAVSRADHSERARPQPGDGPAGEVGAEHRRQRNRPEEQPGLQAPYPRACWR
jgi:hypothetical protein